MRKALWSASKGKAAWGHQGRMQKQQKASFVLQQWKHKWYKPRK